MAVTETTLKIVQIVLVGIEAFHSFVPEAGKKLTIRTLIADASFPDSPAKLVWDFGGAGERVIWGLRRMSIMPHIEVIDASEVDGVKEIALVCENGEATDIFVSARCIVEEE